jgi:hypothetical protein
MVHALREAWRLLTPQGILIDQRPLSTEGPVDIVFAGTSDLAGIMDMNLGLEHDIAADQAIEYVVNDNSYKELSTEKFQVAYYWKTVRGMVADIRKRWKDDVRLDENIVRHAYELFRKHRHGAQVRLLMNMKLTKYEKVS